MCHGLAGRESFDSAVVLTLSRLCVCVLGAACLCVGDKKKAVREESAPYIADSAERKKRPFLASCHCLCAEMVCGA